MIAKIVAAIDPRHGDALLEIGPGLGALTAPLVERVAHVHVIEVDRDLAARLVAEYDPARLTVHRGDALRFDFARLPERLRIVGNLPYNVSTPLLFHVMNYAPRLEDLHFMLQREVVDRMVAAPSTSSYGRLSIMLQYRFTMTKLFDVKPGAFRPPPKVDSAVVRMAPRPAATHGARSEEVLGKVVTAAFTKRRKTLKNALAAVIDEEALRALGLDPGVRPENLGVQDYVAIANAVTERGRVHSRSINSIL